MRRVFFGTSLAPLWQAVEGAVGPSVIGSLCAVAAIVVGGYVIARGTPQALGEEKSTGLSGVFVFLVSGALAYSLVYAISPGYIYSGYLSRHAPFTVFLTDVVVAVALYLAGKVAVSATVACLRHEGVSGFGGYARFSLRRCRFSPGFVSRGILAILATRIHTVDAADALCIS